MSKVNNGKRDNAKDIDVVILMYNLIEYSQNYSKASECLWQQYIDESFLRDNAGTIDSFPGSSASFKLKQKITGETENNRTKSS